jgi:2-methylisocitrate lyase-like PEP mutase family enzyme
MTRPDSPASKLRDLLDRPGIIRSMGAHDVLTALVMEDVGFETVFLGGFGASASVHGLPDLDFLGIDEMAAAVRRMAHRVSIPVIADGDTGHGDLHQVARCVREFESAGAAGMLLEDQVAPKRCGHFDDKSVIPADEMVLKMRAAVDAKADADFVLVARTDARAPEGLDAAIDRVNRYCDAGADIAFVEAPESIDELEEIARRVPHPKFANMLTFGKTPILNAHELEQLGYKFVVAPIETLLVATKAIRRLAEVFLRDGDARSLTDDMVTFDEIKSTLGLDEFLRLRERLER